MKLTQLNENQNTHRKITSVFIMLSKVKARHIRCKVLVGFCEIYLSYDKLLERLKSYVGWVR